MKASSCPDVAVPAAGSPAPRPRRWHWLGLGLLLPAATLFLFAGCNNAPPPRPKKAPEVVVTTPIQGEVVDYQDFTGRLDGLRNVEVRARVSGYITKAPFKEGDYVPENAFLFQIDPRPYQDALNQAEAQVRLQEAQLKYQDELYQRNLRLYKNGQAVNIEDVQQSQAQRDTTAAQLQAAKAAVETAKLNLTWTEVRAPKLDDQVPRSSADTRPPWRVSRRSVDPGNLITADNVATGTALTTLVNDRQLYAYFDVDERSYLNLVERYRTAKGVPQLEAMHFPVLMQLANEGQGQADGGDSLAAGEDEFKHVGYIDFIDNRVTATMGTIRMRGVFDNADGLLKAGLFGHFRLPLGKPYTTLLIDAEALQSDQGRTFVYVVNDKNEVVYRRVTVTHGVRGQRVATEGPDKGKAVPVGLRVVKDGLESGDRVIVSGMQKVRPGATVEVKTKPPPEARPSTLVQLLEKGTKAP